VRTLWCSPCAQEEVQRRLLYADKEGEMVPGTDSDADELVRTHCAASLWPCCGMLTRVFGPWQADDSADQRAWQRQEDFLMLSVAARVGNKPVRCRTRCARPPAGR
jgi:hypothetical protein